MDKFIAIMIGLAVLLVITIVSIIRYIFSGKDIWFDDKKVGEQEIK